MNKNQAKGASGISPKAQAERKARIVAEIGKLISNSQLPAARYEEYISDALKDESILEIWRALKPNPPGIPPLNLPPANKVPEAIQNERTNKAFEKFWPRESFKNSFFDKGVQKILRNKKLLKDWHQSLAPVGHALPNEQLAFPIRCWKVCDNAVLVQMRQPNADELIDFLRDTGSWGSQLLSAVQLFYESGGRKMRLPKTTADLFRQWADWRYFESSSLIRPQDPPHKYAEAVEEIAKSFPKVIRQNNLRVTENALRKFIHDENARREKVMAFWEMNFEAHRKCVFGELLNQAVAAAKEDSEKAAK
jgi:hypothetical protein